MMRRRPHSVRTVPRALRRGARRGTRRAAFTLMEILVALMISALVMTSVLSSLDYTQRAVDAVHNVIETESAGPRLMQLLREDIERLAIYDAAEYRLLKGESDTIAGLDADRLDFLICRRSARPKNDPVRGEFVYAPLVEVGYRLRRHPEHPDFLELYRREDFLHDDEPFEDGEFTLLYDRVINFDIVYYEKPEIEPVWEEEWDSAEREALPYAIEIRMEIEIQPRRSMESLGILGSNRARLEFNDILTIPEEQRWLFRNRLHPVLPTPAAPGGVGPGTGPGGEQPGGVEERTGGGPGARDLPPGGGRDIPAGVNTDVLQGRTPPPGGLGGGGGGGFGGGGGRGGG